MRVLVTGGGGFLGSHLCRRLLDGGDEVVCLDNFFTGSRQHVMTLADNPRFLLVEHDVCDPIALDEVDQVYHLACPASPIQYQKHPITTTKTGVLGTINVLAFAKAHRARVLLASTSEVYGDPQVHPQPESYWGHVNPIGPRSCYDEAKRCAESLAMDYHRHYGIEIKIARIFNTYGPYMCLDDGRVISTFIQQALQQQNLSLHGNGRQTRSFCYVDDLIGGLMALMNSAPSLLGPINIGSNEEISVRALAEEIISLCNSRARIRFLPAQQDDPKQRQPDLSAAKSLLNWQAVTPLKTGLERCITYYKSIADEPV